jgi:hypothetical protein
MNFILPLRIAQAYFPAPAHACKILTIHRLFALFVLGLAGYCVDALEIYPEAGFLVFTVCDFPSFIVHT